MENKLLQYAYRLIDLFPETKPPGVWSDFPKIKKLLTRREKVILELLATGRTNQEISEELFISPTTVKPTCTTSIASWV